MLAWTTRDAFARAGERTISIGVTMIRRPCPLLTTLLGIGIAAVLVAGCGSAAPTSSPTAETTSRPTATPTRTSSIGPSASAAPSVSPSPTPDLGLPHVNAALEDKLPGIIGGITLEKFSMPLSTYMASSTGGDKILYTPWLVKFGKNADDIDLAVAADLTQTETFHAQAIEVPGVDATALSGGFADVARKNKWPVNAKQVGPKSVLEIVDPATDAAGGLGTAYVYATGDVLYVVVTDDPALLLEAMIKLP
ncbi:MAG: hypothetical protein ABSD62_13440 [Candidatus Limnocylindrales bacterium]|jgi:hypothetical protein